MRIILSPADDNLRLWCDQIAELGGKGTRSAIVRAVNRTTKSARGKVVKAISHSTSIPLPDVDKAVTVRRARSSQKGAIAGVILAKGSGVPLKFFSPKQLATGTSVQVWGGRRFIPHAFVWAGNRKSGMPVRDGHVFLRIGEKSKPIERLFGPSVAQAATEGDAAYEFVTTVNEMLPARITHELGRLLEKKK